MVHDVLSAAGGRWRAPGVVLYGIAGAYLAAHIPFLASSLEDIDSINFALGLEDFDPSRHQPHPPGYPVYMVLGRMSLAMLSSAWPELSRISAEALALSIWSALGGAIALIASARVFAVLQERDGDRRSTLAATVLLAAAPLFWISGLRPMSDMPGLAAALLAQSLLLEGLNNPRRLVQGALAAGLAAGLRSQTLWLTIPLMVAGVITHRRAGFVWLVSRPIAAVAGGAVLWAIPLIHASGGFHSYWNALEAQARDDLTAVDMLWTNPTPYRLGIGVIETLAAPWGSIPLAVSVLVAAAVGGIVLLVKQRRGIVLLAVAFGPYAAFHLAFQDPFTARYTLPLLPAVAWLAGRGLAVSRRPGRLLTASLVAGALAVAMPDAASYSRESHPVFRAVDDAEHDQRAASPRVAYAHTEVWRGLQTAASGLEVIEPRRQHAWMGLVDYWRNGGTAPVWFFANPDRTDLALIDPYSRLDRVRYTWAVGARPEFGGTRPMSVDRYRLQAPGWLAGEGWSLTPETGGLAYANRKGLDSGPIEAYVLRRREPMHAVIGGSLAEASDTKAHLELAIDQRVIDRWTLTPAARRFLRFLQVPDGVLNGEGNYATLTIRSSTDVADQHVLVFIRQFDIQPVTRLVWGFGEGWHTLELDPATGRTWRWTSERSVLRIDGAPQDVRLTLRGESPLRYFDSPPMVTVTAGDRFIERFQPDADFEWQLVVPADVIARSGGLITIETDRIYLPAIAEGTADKRRLGLRIYECRVEPLSLASGET